jgi:ubiquinone/menaquinone biosynthesis C-methylase UbiE
MSILNRLLSQCKRPSGAFGRVMARGMNRAHSPLTKWALGQIEVADTAIVLDIGCGGGRTVDRLANMAVNGWVVGLDYSEDSVLVSRRKNSRHIHNGRAEICHASVSFIPYEDNTFDLLTAVETFYFWPAPDADLLEVKRVLKPGGQLLIACAMYKGGKHDKRNQRFVDEINMTYLSVDEFRALLTSSGFDRVQAVVDYDRGWICATARKSELSSIVDHESRT